jgi:phage terminase large subunit-like protein
MTYNRAFKPTAAQLVALDILGSPASEILLYGGSRSGKTFIFLYSILYRAIKAAGSRHAILRRHFNTVKQSVALDTFPKVLRTCQPDLVCPINKTDWFVQLPNGSEIWFGGLDDKDRVDKILGKEFATIWFNECSEISADSVETAMTRLAQKTALKNRVYFDCNPPSKRHWVYKRFFGDGIDPASHASMRMNPSDNRENIAEGYIENVLEKLSKTKRKRFLEGKFDDEVEGALWTQSEIDRDRVHRIPANVDLARVVVALDPSATSTGDEAGVVVAGKGTDGHYYVMDDMSVQGSPATWARAACTAYYRHKADRLVYESNQGGEMVAGTIEAVDKNVPVMPVHASRGKITRAEPIAALSEQGLVHMVGEFALLEDELCQWSAGDPDSPNRLDAMVWALTELSGGVDVKYEYEALKGIGVF